MVSSPFLPKKTYANHSLGLILVNGHLFVYPPPTDWPPLPPLSPVGAPIIQENKKHFPILDIFIANSWADTPCARIERSKDEDQRSQAKKNI